MPLNDSGKEITEDDDIFIDDPKQLASLDLSLPPLGRANSRGTCNQLVCLACGASAHTWSKLGGLCESYTLPSPLYV